MRKQSVSSVTRPFAAGLALVAVAAAVQMPAGVHAQSSQAAATPVYATLNQVMRGVQFPLSNVVFSSQGNDPALVKQDARPSAATDLLASAFGGWQAVENSGLGLAESATLLTIPGRKCANGVEVPVQNADWIRFVQGLRDAGDAAYRAAQSRNQDKMLEVSEQVAASCSNCHQVYRKSRHAGDALVNRCKP
jgi:hypothetical protein